MPGANIAGISGAGKTLLYRAITSAITASGREVVLAFPQAMTTTAFQHLANSPSAQAIQTLDWANAIVSFAEKIHRQAVQGDLLLDSENYPFNWLPMLLLEGFIFDIPLHKLAIEREQTLSLETRLAALGVVLVLLVVPDHMIKEQCVISTRSVRGTGWNNHLQCLGGDDDQRADYFRQQQQRLIQWADQSPLTTVRISTGDRDWSTHAAAVVHRIDKHGELWSSEQLELAAAPSRTRVGSLC